MRPFSVENDLKVMAVYLANLKILEEVRPGVSSGGISAESRAEAERIVTDTESYLSGVKSRFVIRITSKSRRRFRKFSSQRALLKLQCQAMKEVFCKRRVNQQVVLTKKQEKRLKSFCYSAYEKVLSPRWLPRFEEEDLCKLERAFAELPISSPDKKQYDEALEEHRKARDQALSVLGSSALDFEDPIVRVRKKAEESYQALLKHYFEYVPILLGDSMIQELFKKQVIVSELPLEVFFRHPLVTNFLREAEYVEKMVYLSGDRIEMGRESGLPEIKFEGRYLPIRELPGYSDGSFKNLLGWKTMGLAHYGKHFNLKEAESKLQCDHGYVYRSGMGLSALSPRTWNYRNEKGCWE